MLSLKKKDILQSFSIPKKLNLGINDEGEWSLHDISNSNHTLFTGAMGCGKSMSALMSVYAFLKSNPNTLLIVADFYKGATDFKDIKYNNKLELNDAACVKAINATYNEMLIRKKLIRQNSAKSYLECGVPLSPILLVIEECQGIQLELEWDKLHSIDNTIANKLKMILKEGGACGITIFLIGQAYNEYYMPMTLLKLMNHKRVFKCNGETNKLHSVLTNLDHYNTIAHEHKGRASDESSVYQFLYLGKAFLVENPLVSAPVKTLIDFPTDLQSVKKISFFEGKSLKDFFIF